MSTRRRSRLIGLAAQTLAVSGLVGVAPAGAQTPGFFIGVKGGLNVSTLSIDDPGNRDLNIERRPGFALGAYLQCGGIGRFTLQGEVTYSRNGADLQTQGEVAEVELDYLRVPVLVVVRLGPEAPGLRPIVFAGPQLAFETRCQQRVGVGGSSVACRSEELENPLDTNRVEFGLVFGGGLEIPVRALTMQLDARYNLGLTNVNGATDAHSVNVMNRGWTFAVGIGRPFGSGRP